MVRHWLVNDACLAVQVSMRQAAVVTARAGLAEAEARLERFGPRVRFVNADLDQPIPVEPVDAVFSTATFHWVKDHRRLYGHLAEVLRPGGQLVAQFGGAGNIRSVIAALVSLGEPEPDTWCYPTPDEETAVLQRAGFTDIHAWLHDEPTPLDRGGPLEDYIEKIILRAQVEAKPEPERRPFAEAVAAALRKPEIDYVRINVVARRLG
jgi:trans-aconitate 2-methyltransferase